VQAEYLLYVNRNMLKHFVKLFLSVGNGECLALLHDVTMRSKHLHATCYLPHARFVSFWQD